MVNPALLASVDALPLDEQIELVEHVNSNLRHTQVSDADRALIEGRARDTDPMRWSSLEHFRRTDTQPAGVTRNVRVHNGVEDDLFEAFTS